MEPPSDARARLRELRTQLDLSKSEAARLAGVSRRAWHEAEEGPPDPEVDGRDQLVEEMLALFRQIFRG